MHALWCCGAAHTLLKAQVLEMGSKAMSCCRRRRRDEEKSECSLRGGGVMINSEGSGAGEWMP